MNILPSRTKTGKTQGKHGQTVLKQRRCAKRQKKETANLYFRVTGQKANCDGHTAILVDSNQR